MSKKITRKRQYTKRQKVVMHKWLAYTGWEFMVPDKGELFSDAIKKNRRWLQNVIDQANNIGQDLVN